MWNKSSGNQADYLELEFSKKSSGEDFVDVVKSFFTYYLVCSTFIPVSLYVTFEMTKIFQMYFITNDAEIYSEISD
jgi:magnesium-transporting ATPase (P-type)